jgi:hypothetical protein
VEESRVSILKPIVYIFGIVVALYVVLMNAAPMRVREPLQKFRKTRAFGLILGLSILALFLARLIIYIDTGK